MLIFLVDDSMAMRERLAVLLSDLDEAVIVGQAGNSKEALESIRRLRPEVVILDIQMPGGSGLSVLQAVKQESEPPVVIMLTNHVCLPYKEKCAELGADFFLDKSHDFDHLHQILTDLINRSSPQAIA
jgi:DNA-binding NarL/FixJ family response regulator